MNAYDITETETLADAYAPLDLENPNAEQLADAADYLADYLEG